MSCGELAGELKTDREESLMKHVGFVYAYAKKVKNRKINDEKGGDKQKKQESCSTIKNKTHFSLLVFDCDFEDALLIISMGAIWWGTRGTCPPHFFKRGGHNMLCPPTFFS